MGPQETPRAPLRQPLDGHSAARGSPLWTTGTSHHEGVKIGREKGVGIGSDLTNSVAFVDRTPDKPSVTAIIDYHEAGIESDADPRFCKHRGVYRFPLSEPSEGMGSDRSGKPMSHADFAAWLEDRIGDVIAPPDHLAGADTLTEADLKLVELLKTLGGQFVGPSRLLDLSRGLKLTEEARFTSVQNLTSGEVELAYQNEHREEAGAPLKVPSIFLLGIPVFDRGPMYRIPVRLRYRLAGSKLTWLSCAAAPTTPLTMRSMKTLRNSGRRTDCRYSPVRPKHDIDVGQYRDGRAPLARSDHAHLRRPRAADMSVEIFACMREEGAADCCRQ